MKSRVSVLLSLLLLVGCEPDKRPTISTQPTTKPRPVPAASPDDSPMVPEPQVAADTAGLGNRITQLQLIRARVGQLNGVRRWEKVVKRDLYNSTEGGEATYYYQNGRVARIVARNYGEMGRWLGEYYLWPDGQLTFVFETDYEYNQPYYQDSAWVRKMGGGKQFDVAKSRVTNTRSYFAQGRLMLQRDDAREASAAKKSLQTEQKRLQADLTDLLQALNHPQ